MRKLTLSIQDLEVATFQTHELQDARGTVAAQSATSFAEEPTCDAPTCVARTCPGWPQATCDGETCGVGPTCDPYC